MFVRFIAHAGVSIEEAGRSILIDPWFLDSTPDHPIIESIGESFKTIDFQIPQTPERIEEYAPDAILVSHFHPHHSPARDIRLLCENAIARGKTIHICHAVPDEKTAAVLKERIVPGAVTHAMEPGDAFAVGPFVIEARAHTVPMHRAWYVRSPTGSVLHIGDGRLNKDPRVRDIDPIWRECEGLAPSLLFMSSGGHEARFTDAQGVRQILEAGICTPVEAAKIVRVIQPRAAAIFGFYNHSIFKDRIERILPAAQTEEAFAWALEWLAPAIRNVRLTPGMTFGVGEQARDEPCDIYVPS